MPLVSQLYAVMNGIEFLGSFLSYDFKVSKREVDSQPRHTGADTTCWPSNLMQRDKYRPCNSLVNVKIGPVSYRKKSRDSL